jgi:hypothetical protein
MNSDEETIELDTFTFGLLIGALDGKIRHVTLQKRDEPAVTGFVVLGRPDVVYVERKAK